MSKRCPECHHVNEDSRIFCSACGAPLDANLRLIQDLEKQHKGPAKPREAAPPQREVNMRTSESQPSQKKSSPLPWIILGAVVLAAAVWFLFL